MRTLLVNDTHLGVKRQAGTTPASRLALEDWMMEMFEGIIRRIPHDRLVIVGDLFDKRNVPEYIMLQVIQILRDENCTIIAGNHDLGGVDDYTLSSAEFVARVSGSAWVDKPAYLPGGLYVVPHMHNQSEFDAAVQKIPDGTVTLVHANIDSPWAQSDHSLNLSKEQIAGLEKRGVEIISAHEHAPRQYMKNVMVLGNQFPSSIADCLSGPKRCAVIEGDEFEVVDTWDGSGFEEVHWGAQKPSTAKFISIGGKCTPEEYPSILRAISEQRRQSDAFVIKNAVEVTTSEMVLGVKEVDEFNIIEMFLSLLSDEVREKVEAEI